MSDDKAFKNAKEALGLHLYGMEQDGDSIPEPSPLSALQPDKDEVVTMIEIFMPAFRDKMQGRLYIMRKFSYILILTTVLLSIFSCLMSNLAFAAAQEIEWEKSYGGSGRDWARDIQQTNDGGYIVAGSSNSKDGDVTGNHGKYDFWIVKLNPEGNIVWQKSLGGSNNDCAYSVQQTTDGGYIVAGVSDSNDGDVGQNRGRSDGWVVKLDGNGEIKWQKTYGGSALDWISDIRQTEDGGYIFTGSSHSDDGDASGNHGRDYGFFKLDPSRDCWVVKLDSEGEILWGKMYGGSKDEGGQAIKQTKDGGYIVAAVSNSSDGDLKNFKEGESHDFWIIKLDATGNIDWQKLFGGSKIDIANSIQQTMDNGYIVAGYTVSNDGDVSLKHGVHDYWIIKLDVDGDLMWQRTLGGKRFQWATNVQQTIDGDYIIAGYSDSIDGDVTGNHGHDDYWIVKLNTEGGIVWEKSLGGSGYDEAYSLQKTSDGGYIIAGSSDSRDGDVSGNHDSLDFWIIKMPSEVICASVL